jgi:WD40 repeat protein
MRGSGVRVVLIGTGTHPEGAAIPDVPAVAATITELGRCLVNTCGVNPAHVTSRIDTADSGELDSLIRSASREADRLFLLYYVGHGLVDERQRLHLATAATPSAYQIPHGRALPFDVVKESVFGTAGRDRGTVIVLDCCYSGRVTTDAGTPAQAGFAQAAIRGSFVMTSAASDEQAWALRGDPYTAFSGELIRLLQDGDPDGPPSLTFDGVYEKLSRTLADRGAPRPRRHAEDSVGSLVVAANPAYRQPRIAPPRTDVFAVARDKPPCPYKDLRAFEVEDHALFFGREELIARLLERVRERVSDPGIQVVTGPSAVGKSSLLRAGLMHGIAVGELGIPGSAAWDQLPPLTPGADPLQALAAVLAPHLPSGSAAGGPDAVRGQLAESPLAAASLIRQLRPAGTEDASRRAVIVVDQFEEILTECKDEEVRGAFINALCAAALPSPDGGSPAALVILGLRSDFLGAFSTYPELSQALGATALVVGPMTAGELRRAIVGPAEAAGLGLEDGLAEVLLRDAAPAIAVGRSGVTGQGVLPHLSHALYATWRECDYESWQDSDGRLQQGWFLTTTAYQKIGGIQGALSASADAVYEGLTPDLQRQARRILPELVQTLTVGDTQIDTLRRVSREELRSDPGESEAADAVIDAFTDARLLTADGDYVEIAHEALLNTWKLLREWADADRQWRVTRQQIHEAAVAWRSDGRHPSGLLQGPRLAAVKAVMNGHGKLAELATGDAQYLAQSMRRARRAARRPIEAIVVLTLLLTLAVSGGVYTLHLRDVALQQGQAARSAVLDAESRTISESNPRESLLLALDAYHSQATPKTYAQLLVSVARTRYTGILLGHATAVEAVAYRPGGSVLASGYGNGAVIVWNAVQGKRVAAFKAAGPVWDMAFSPDGGTLAVGTRTGSVQLWNFTDPARPVLATTLSAVAYGDTASDNALASVAFAPEADILAVTDNHSVLTIWNVTRASAPELLSQTDVIKHHPGYTAGLVAFSPDDRTLLMGSSSIPRAALWDVGNPARPRYLAGLSCPGSGISAVAFSPGSGFAVTGVGPTGHAYLWNIAHRRAPALVSTMTGQGGPVLGLAYSADGTRLATASADGTTVLWDVSQPTRPGRLAVLRGQQSPVNTVAFSPDGNTIATGSENDSIMLWNGDAATDTPVLATVPGPRRTDRVTALAYDGSLLALGHAQEGTVALWNTSDPARPRWLTTLPAPKGSARVEGMALSPKRRMLAVATSAADGSAKTSVTLWSLASPGKPAKLGVLPDGANRIAAFDQAGTMIAALNRSGRIELFNITNPGDPRLVGSTAAFRGDPDTAAFSPDAHVIAAGGSGLSLYGISGSRPPKLLSNTDREDTAVYATAFNSDGSLLASTTATAGVLLWNVSDPGRPVADLTANTGTTSGVAFGPGNILATSGYNRVTILWNLTHPATPVQLATLTKQAAPVGPIAFNPGGTTLATASWDSTVVLWNVARLTTLMRQPALSACQIAGPGNVPSTWSADVPGIPYQPGCP